MSDDRNPPPEDNLVLLPTAAALLREREAEARLGEQPASVQGWFEATQDDEALDARLRSFLDTLLPDEDEARSDEEDERPSTLEVRRQRQAHRLAAQPRALRAWHDAATDGGARDLRLSARADRLCQAPSAAPRWGMRLLAASVALGVGIGLAARLAQEPERAVEEAALRSLPPEVLDEGPAVISPGVGEEPPGLAVRPEPTESDRVPRAAPPPSLRRSPPEVAPALQAPPGEALAAVESRVEADGGGAPVVRPGSPLLQGELDAGSGTARLQPLAGLDLRLDKGTLRLAGTASEPLIVLGPDSSVRVDLDRARTEPDFARLRVRGYAGQVQVLGTRFTVATPSGGLEVATRKGLVRVDCASGESELVPASTSRRCEPQADARLLVHMQALDRPAVPGQVRLSPEEQYQHLRGQLKASGGEAFLPTADVMLSRALSDPGLRRAIEAVRVEALCELGWDAQARRAAQAWLAEGQGPGAELLQRVARGDCPAD